ncbi:hypothetical protein ACFQE7_19250 [Nonomuraea ferruginea]
MLSPDHEITHAEGYRANVNLDPVTFRPTPISDESRAAAGPLFLPVAAG